GNAGVTSTDCEPYTTTRLTQFAQANEGNGQARDAFNKATELTSFNAFLMEDGYSEDFRADFIDYALTKSFFDFPSQADFRNLLNNYFANPNKFKFVSPFLEAPNAPIRAGKYKVTLKVTYDKSKPWSLGLNGTEADSKAVIEVILERLQAPDPDSPFYYMPFDGLLGKDTPNGRQGYGVNFREQSIESITFNEPSDLAETILSSTIANSNPIPNGWVLTSVENDFKKLNTDQSTRGLVLNVERRPAQQQINVIFSPSKATPVVLKIAGGKSDKAFAYYSLTLNGEPQLTGENIAYWNSIALRCKDFTGRDSATAYRDSPDLHAGVGVTKCSGAGLSTSHYGLEFCDIKKAGDLYLGTVFFTPQEGTAGTLRLVDAQDDGTQFIKQGSNASNTEVTEQLAIGGDFPSEQIKSIQKVIQLVKEGQVCVEGVGNSANARFFWNPAAILAGTEGITGTEGTTLTGGVGYRALVQELATVSREDLAELCITD
ncbi:MAG: hypothetical protein Q7S92_00440, partial [Candidatus Diapherotrites archaeon]|nr:hypothetical protein [Candidatus Diapherotrites archaeon]